MRTKRKLQRSSLERGQAIVLIAFAMIGLLAFGVLAIDGSRFFDQRRTSQNAADVSSLAGVQRAFAPPTGMSATYKNIIKEINRVAEINSIPDTDGIAGNETDLNVRAWWINAAGDYVLVTGGTAVGTTEPPPNDAKIDVGLHGDHAIPVGVRGIKVRVLLPYRTFLGGIIGQAQSQAQADSVAIRSTVPPVPTVPGAPDIKKISVFNPGTTCANPYKSFYIAASGNTNNFDLGINAFFGGDVGMGGGNLNAGLYKNPDPDSPGTASFGTTDPLLGGIDTDSDDTVVTGWVNPYGPTQFDYPEFFAAPGAVTNYTARDFDPDSVRTPTNVVYQAAIADGMPASYYHDVSKLSPKSDPSYTPAANGAALAAAMATGGPGIYYIDGDVQINTFWDEGSHQGLIATGKVELAVGNGANKLGRADGAVGVTGAHWGYNMSVFAGGSPSAPGKECFDSRTGASNEPIFWTSNQQANWSGNIFVPNGLVQIADNGSSGGDHEHNPIFSYSLVVGDGTNANNIQFQPCEDCFDGQPDTYATTMQQ